MDLNNYSIARSFQVWQMPEFIALCNRLGIPRDLQTTGITITIGPDADDLVKISQEYNAVDTTTLENKEYRTFVPKST